MSAGVALRDRVSDLVERCQVAVDGRARWPEPESDQLPSMALVGPYNAGKSTIVKALTGADVLIGAAPTTQEAEAFTWDGRALLIDTPGVYTGREDEEAHNAETDVAVSAADLVLFVLTPSGLDDTEAAYLIDLLVERRRSASIMLVVNKALASANPDAMIQHLAEIIAPISIADVPTVLVDAKTYLTAEAMDGRPAHQLRDASGLDEFTVKLQAFIDSHIGAARLVQPLNVARATLDRAIDVSADVDPSEADLLRDHRRRRREIKKAGDRIRSDASQAIDRGTRNIELSGGTLARVVLELSDDEREARIDAALEEVVAAQADIVDALGRVFDEADRRLNSTFQDFEADRQRRIELDGGGLPTVGDEVRRQGNSSGARNAGVVGQGLQNLGGAFKAGNRAGELGHRIVYGIGKKVGHTFKPWEAVKLTAKVGKGLAVAGAVIEVGAQVGARVAARKQANAEHMARAHVRDQFATCAIEVAEAAMAAVEEELSSFLGPELAVSDDLIAEIEGRMRGEHEFIALATELRAEIDRLLDEVS